MAKNQKILSALIMMTVMIMMMSMNMKMMRTMQRTCHQLAPTAAASEFHPRKVGGTSTMTQRPTAMKVVVIEPKVFEDLKASPINYVTCVLY